MKQVTRIKEQEKRNKNKGIGKMIKNKGTRIKEQE